ncbi:MAG: hypothetical protein R3E12_15290 [Candidatus Eisenbacteria bacterium]
MEITGGLTIEGDIATVTARLRLVDSGYSFTNHQATLFLVENDVLFWGSEWDEVVRMVRSTPISLTLQGQEVEVRESFDLAGAQAVPIDRDHLFAVACYEQIDGNMETIQATDFSTFDNFFVPAYTTRIEATPDGGGTATFFGSIMNIAENADIVDLSVSGFGWPASFQIEGDPVWHTQYSLPIPAGGSIPVILRVDTDQERRIGEGFLVADSAISGQHYDAPFSVFNRSPAILLVDDDNPSTNEVGYAEALQASDYLFQQHSVPAGEDGPSARRMSGYDAVIWETGFNLQTLTMNDTQALAEYLDNGGGLLLQSMEYLSLNGSNPFNGPYLGLESFLNNARADAAAGVAGDPISDGMSFPMLEWPTPAYNKVDVVHPTAQASEVFRKQTGDPIAIRSELPKGSRTVFNTVLLSAFGDGPEPSNKTAVVRQSIDWIVEDVANPAGAPEGFLTGRTIQLGATPNPSTGVTTVRFQIPNGVERAHASLFITDVGGRLVKPLLDAPITPGWHESSWDGSDKAGRTVESGAYFAVLRCAQQTSSIKLLRIR